MIPDDEDDLKCVLPPEEAMAQIIDQNCDYQTLLFARRAAFASNTDAALEAAKEAIKIRYRRSEQFNVSSLNDVTLEPYLKDIVNEIKTRLSGVSYHIFEIGGLLCLAERLLPRGKWTEWVRNIPMALRSAHNYKNVYRCCFGRPEALAWLKPTQLYVVCSTTYEAELQEFILANAEGVHPASTEELILVGELVRRGEIGMEDERVLNLVRSKRKGEYVKRVQWHLKKVIAKMNATINVLRVISLENRPEAMLPLNEKETYPLPKAIKLLEELKLVIKKASDGYENPNAYDSDLQPLQICKDCRYRDDAMTDLNLDYRTRHPDDRNFEDAAEDLAMINAEVAAENDPAPSDL